MCRVAALIAAAAVGLGTPAAADAAIQLDAGPNTATTARFELDFGNAGGNVERVDGIRWRGSGGTLGPSVVASGGSGPTCAPGDTLEAWGQAHGDSNPQPVLVAAGSNGSWQPRGRTVEITSGVPASCYGDSVSTAVRTRYAFFDSGAAANKIRVERRFAFGAMTPGYANTLGLRAYMPRLSEAHSQVVHPNSAGTALVVDATCTDGCIQTNWNGTWFALNNPSTNAGIVVLRDPANASPARLLLDHDAFSSSNSSSATLTKPDGGWKAALVETEYLCFYDAASWPSATRGPSSPPPGCTAAAVPLNVAAPTIAGTAKEGEQLTVNPGTWEYQTGTFGYQWARCREGSCAAIASATAASYTATDADAGHALRVTVTATAAGGETDSATTAPTAAITPLPPANVTPPAITGSTAPGELLTAQPGTWRGFPSSYAFAWRRCDATGAACADIAGATASTYRLTGDDLGRRFRVRVVASNAAGPSPAAESAATGTVATGGVAPSNTRAPRIDIPRDPPRTGDTFRADTGGWTGSPTSLQLQWRRCNGLGADCADIPGATASTYIAGAIDLERTLRLRVSATNAGGTSAPVESAATPFIRQGTLTARLAISPTPSCVGTDTFLDASGSSGPARIVEYYLMVYYPQWDTFLGKRLDDDRVIRRLAGEDLRPIGEGVVRRDLYRGPSPVLRRTFSWNAASLASGAPSAGWSNHDYQQYWAEERANPTYHRLDGRVALRVLDEAGATSWAEVELKFGQGTNKQSRKRCPALKRAAGLNTRLTIRPVRAGGTSLAAAVPCRGQSACDGRLSATLLSGFARSAQRGRRAPVVAFKHFVVPAGRTRTVRTALMPSAKRLLRRRGRLRVAVNVNLVGDAGTTASRTRRLTLSARR